MKTLALLPLFAVSMAQAAPALTPWNNMLGKFSVPATCVLDSNEGFTKVLIEKTEDGEGLTLTAYNTEDKGEVSLAIINLKRKAQGTDGDVFFTVSDLKENSFASTEHFVRKGSDTWPDLETKQTTRLDLKDGVLTYTRIHQTNNSAPKASVCELTSLREDAKEITFSKINSLKNASLASLAKAADAAIKADFDMDQANFQILKLQLNKGKPNQAEIKEVLALAGIPTSISEITVSTVSVNADPMKTAEKALATAYANAGKVPALLKLQKAMADVLRNKKSTMKAIAVTWTQSDADGEGLLLIDEATGEVYYLGSGYFS